MVANKFSPAVRERYGKIRRMNVHASIQGNIAHIPAQGNYIDLKGLHKFFGCPVIFLSGGHALWGPDAPFNGSCGMEGPYVIAEIGKTVFQCDPFSGRLPVRSVAEYKDRFKG